MLIIETILLGISFFTFINYWPKTTAITKEVTKSCTGNIQSITPSPLKLSYIDDFTGISGNGLSSEQIQWTVIDSPYAPRSSPSPITHHLEIDTKQVKIEAVKREDININNLMTGGASYAASLIDDNYKKAGDLIAGFLLKSGESVFTFENADIDNDGQQEQVVTAWGIGGNHPPHTGYIIKNNTILLTIPLDAGGMYAAKDHNGFYVKQSLYENNAPLCCRTGYRLYRVVFEGGEYKPVWEQKIDYLNVK